MALDLIVPEWEAPRHVRALATTRHGGVSAAPWASLNLGDHVGDKPESVAENRRRVSAYLPAMPPWLRQVHGTRCVDATLAAPNTEADAICSRRQGLVCAVMTADCLPVLLCDAAGTVVAAAHAGWRGLAAGVLEETVRQMGVPAEQLMAWIGPAIGPAAFEVGAEVRETFLRQGAQAEAAFVAHGRDKYLCDLPLLARQRLLAAGVSRSTSAELCTFAHPERFFSFRRDGVTGRMATCIWLE